MRDPQGLLRGLVIFALSLAGTASAQSSSARLTGRVGNYTGYMLEDERVRHHRYELELEQTTKFGFRLSTVMEGRFRLDAALLPEEQAPRELMDRAVREDEMAEAEARQLYLDYLGDSFRVTAGLMLIDWVESLSPLASDVLTPLDLRHGGFGDAGSLIRPVGGARLNHGFIGGSLDWLVVPLPKPHRLPKGENGYLSYDDLEESLAGVDFTLEDRPIPKGIKDTEIGVRYLTQVGGLELTLLAYRGHHRTPVLEVESINAGERFEVRTTYPSLNTYGAFLGYAGDAWVSRLMFIHEPRRAPRVRTLPETGDEDPYETRSRIGFGFDFVFSKHLKIYTEQFATRISAYPKKEGTGEEGEDAADAGDTGDFDDGRTVTSGEGREPVRDERNPKDDYVASFRLTNETLSWATFSLEGVLARPKSAHILIPQAAFRFGVDYTLTLGARIIRSLDPLSPYEPLKNASHLYLSLFKAFSTP